MNLCSFRQLMLLTSFLFILSCSKTKEHEDIKVPIIDSVTTIDPSKEFIADSIFYMSSPVNHSIDLNGDGIKDINFRINTETWQTSSMDSFSVTPLHNGIQIATKDSIFYWTRDSIVCKLTASDSLIFRKSEMCSVSHPKKSNSLALTFVCVISTLDSTLNYSDFLNTTLIYNSSSSGTLAPCYGYVYSTYFVGNGIGKLNYLHFKMDGKKYALQLSDSIPYLIFHSVKKF